MNKSICYTGKEAQVADGGLSFVVDFTHSKKAKKPKLTSKKGRNGKGDNVDEVSGLIK